MAGAVGRNRDGITLGAPLGAAAAWARPAALKASLGAALEREWDERRFFLWLPVCAGAGVVLYFQANHEPSRVFAMLLWVAATLVAATLRGSPRAFVPAVGVAALAAGFTLAALRAERVGHPVLTHITIAKLAGIVEAADHRRAGTRFILRVRAPSDGAPVTRVRLTTRRDDPVEAGDAVAITARLVPPARAALPGGYDFARDAYFLGLDAVGSVLGRIRIQVPQGDLGWGERWTIGIDRIRNALVARVRETLDGDTGAIAAAMVTGKRDLLSDDGRDLIREAGIFHIITIAGVQMTLVAGALFFVFRAGLTLVPGLALHRPIKQWAAGAAIIGAIAYDLLTGSRIGTQRALFMTVIVLGAVLWNRRAFTMRNLALAALAVIVVEPETILGASFQLSFAAVAALVAVQEARGSPKVRARPRADENPGFLGSVTERMVGLGLQGRDLLIATLCATAATMPFMAANFHEISPYVLFGNPLTLAVIEIFAVPGALIGTALALLGLDGPVWHWVGFGIAIVLWAARLIAAAPGATLHLPAFAPWTPACAALALASAVLWHSPILRLTAVPFALLALCGALAGPRFDLVVAPTGDTLAFRDASGHLAAIGRTNTFGVAQWLTADGDDRDPRAASGAAAARCDALGCVATVLDGRVLSLVLKPDAFDEDCQRADIVVTPLYAPARCGAEMVVDRGTLDQSGAAVVTVRNGGLFIAPARPRGEDRPWSPAALQPHLRPGHDRPNADP